MPQPPDRRAQQETIAPIGNALRAAFGADNHESLGDDISRLMIALSWEPDADAPDDPEDR